MGVAWEKGKGSRCTGSRCYEKRLAINAELQTGYGKRDFHSLSSIWSTPVLHPGSWDRQGEPCKSGDTICLLLICIQCSACFQTYLDLTHQPNTLRLLLYFFCWNILCPCLKTGKALWILVETKMKFIFAPQVFLLRSLHLNSLILERHFWVWWG